MNKHDSLKYKIERIALNNSNKWFSKIIVYFNWEWIIGFLAVSGLYITPMVCIDKNFVNTKTGFGAVLLNYFQLLIDVFGNFGLAIHAMICVCIVVLLKSLSIAGEALASDRSNQSLKGRM